MEDHTKLRDNILCYLNNFGRYRKRDVEPEQIKLGLTNELDCSKILIPTGKKKKAKNV